MAASARFRVLFVCMGNICRSPAGECVLRHLAARSEPSSLIDCDSAGTIDLHTGNPPDPRIRAAARARGINVAGSARQVTHADLDAFDLVVAMDDDNRAYLDALHEHHGGRAEIRSFCEFCRESRHHGLTEVPDPYYGGADGFERVMDLLEDGCAGLLERARERVA